MGDTEAECERERVSYFIVIFSGSSVHLCSMVPVRLIQFAKAQWGRNTFTHTVSDI